MIRLIMIMLSSSYLLACSPGGETASTQYYIDVHELGAGNVTAEAVAEAHEKDLEVQDKYGVNFIKYWVDEEQGKVYCLSEAKNTESITEAHKEAHGLIPHKIYPMEEGVAAEEKGGKTFFLDIHELGHGNVTAEAVAEAHEKDLAVQDAYGVNFINYWVNEKEGTVVCLSEANDSTSVINAHREAHGLIPTSIAKVTQGE